MRVSTAAAILILAAGVAPSVALPSGPPPSRPWRPLPNQPKPLPPNPPPPPPPSSLSLSFMSRPSSSSPVTAEVGKPLPDRPGLEKPLPLPPLEPLRGPSSEPQPQPAPKSTMQKLFGKLKLKGRTLIADSDEVVGQPYSRRELLERFDELIMLAARAHEYEQELLATPMDNLD